MEPPLKLLVTGGAGFIGSNLVRHLLAESPHHVVTVDSLTYAGNIASLEGCMDHPHHTFVHGDIRDAALLDRVFAGHRPDGVMHLAAESHVDRSIDGPDAFVETNIVGTYRLLQAALSHFRTLHGTDRDRFRFLHVSTDEVYGTLVPGDPAFTEATPYSPHSPYSASKAASDHLARAWHDTYGLPVMVTNCSNNYGPYQFPEKLIPVVILKCLRGEPIPVYGKGANIRDWLYVADHCSALRTAIERGTPGETYNIGGNNERTNLDLVKLLCSILDELRPAARPYHELITFVADRPGHDLRYAINPAKIAADLGWSPSENPESGFRKTVAWYLENQVWWGNILSGDHRLDRIGLEHNTPTPRHA